MVMVHRRALRIRIEDVIYRLFNEELGSGCSNIDRYVAELVDENKKIPKYLKSEDLNNCLISVTYTIEEVDLEITEINSYEKIVYIYIF